MSRRAVPKANITEVRRHEGIAVSRRTVSKANSTAACKVEATK